MEQSIVANEYVLDFLLAGKCECKIENINTGNSFMYKIDKSGEGKLFFMKVLRPNGFVYAGFIKKERDGSFTYSKGTKGTVDAEAQEVQALLYVFNNAQKLPKVILVHHTGRCSRCHRKLSDPESLRRGLGPECAKKN